MNALLVGIDCATVDAKTGLARASYNDGRVTLKEALCSRERSPAEIVTEWLTGDGEPALLAMDAPLGWPAPLARSLAAHRAGETIPTERDDLFRRATDRFIKKKLKKTPLDVGADRIARTAHAALKLLGEVRTGLGPRMIPLAWDPALVGTAVIEVYPAATLAAHGIPSKGYKAPDQAAARREILAWLGTLIDVGECAAELELSADILDAAVCVIAAKDFLDGHALPPEDRDLAAQEGWIWCSRKDR